jgi:AcrR family transcriptional regulator
MAARRRKLSKLAEGGDGQADQSSASLSSRDKVLDAAVRVAIRDGILAMTLDAVAQEASVSKGGLLYHFRSKDELISAMLVYFRAKTQKVIEARVASDPNPRGRWFRATVQTIWSPRDSREGEGKTQSDTSRFFTSMLTAFANNPHLLDPVRQNMCQTRTQLLAEGPNGLRQIALGAAMHGLLLWQHLGVITADDPAYQSILNELLSLAEAPDSPIVKE